MYDKFHAHESNNTDIVVDRFSLVMHRLHYAQIKKSVKIMVIIVTF